ncbi:MAG: retroviral-like aspartic protease family protein [Chthoniobacterales bacterium]
MIRKLIFILGVVLATFISSNHASARISLEALEHDGYGVVELKRPKPNVLTVTAAINGHNVRLIVDTGAISDGIALETDQLRSISVASEGKAGTATTFAGKQIALQGAHAKVTLGNVEISGVPLRIGSMDALRRAESVRTLGVDGLLGAGFLKTCSAVIDLHNLRLYLRPPGKGHRVDLGPGLRAAGLAEVHFADRCVVDIAINDTPGKMVMDTGAFLATADTDFAYKAHASVGGSLVGYEDATGAVGRTEIAHLKSFKIGGVPVSAPDLRLTKFHFSKSQAELIGLLGMDILGRNGTIIDFGQQKLYFYPLQ